MPISKHHLYSLSYSTHPAVPTSTSSPRRPYPGPTSDDHAPATPGLWSALSSRPSSHMSKIHSLDCFRSFHGDLASHMSADHSNCDHDEVATFSAASATSSSTSSSTILQVVGWTRHQDREHEGQYDCVYTRHQSAPVDVVPPSQWRSHREKRANTERRRIIKQAREAMGRRAEWEEDEEQQHADEEEEEEEEEEDEEEPEAQEEGSRLPPHEELAKERAAAASCGGTAFSLCQGMGRTLKGRDLCRVRNAILKQTGFIS